MHVFKVILTVLAVTAGLIVLNGESPRAAAGPEPAPRTTYQLYLPLVVKSGAAGAPVITGFGAAPSTIAPGGTSTLSWSTTGATSQSISPSVGAVTGSSVNVSPSTTTEYTLSATNASGTTIAKTMVTVNAGGGSSSAQFFLPLIGGSDPFPTYGTSVAIDSSGGIHVGYALYSGTDNGARPAYYAYCAANCTTIGNWSLTRLSDQIKDVRVALDPASGRPRMLLYSFDNGSNTYQYRYASCQSNCTNAGSWTITVLVTNSEIPSAREDKNNRYFGIDPQGGPGFLYTDNAEGHAGTFYAHCSANCANLANWNELLLTDQGVIRPTLAFTSGGAPRVVASYYVADDPEYNLPLWKLLYVACLSSCTNLGGSTWDATFISPMIGDGSFSLQVDKNDRPRLALYPTSAVLSEMTPGQLYYLTCNNSTCMNAADWTKTSVGTPIAEGGGVDLKLDANDHPRMAFQRGDSGLGYAWCDASCGATASWQTRTLESTNAVQALYPPGLPQYQGCPILTWLNGVRPSLALDAAGKPRVGYDTELWWGGTNPNIQCDLDVPVARFGIFQ